MKRDRWSGTVARLGCGAERTTTRAGAEGLTVTVGFLATGCAFAGNADRAGAARLGFDAGSLGFDAGFCFTGFDAGRRTGAWTTSDDVGC